MQLAEQNTLLLQHHLDDQATVRASTGESETVAALTQMAPAWEALSAQAGHAASPMQSHAWARACAAAFNTADKLRVIATGDKAAPSAIAPLVEHGGWLKHLEMLGVAELYEPTDLLYANAPALETLAAQLATLGTPLRLGRLPADSPTIPALQKAFAGRAWLHLAEVAPTPSLPLDASWCEPELKFNAGRRSDFRRAQRHAEQFGAVSYEMRAPTPDELEPLLEEAYTVECAGWKGATGTALSRDTTRGAFYRRYAIAAAEQGHLRLCFMRLDGRAVAMQFALEYNQRFWLLKIGYDEKYARCSPGTLLMLYSVRYAATRGLQSYELLGSAEPWTSQWTKLERPCVALRAYPFNLSGAAKLASDGARVLLKRLKEKWQERSQQKPGGAA